MRITRAAFGVILKFSDLFDDVMMLLDELDLIGDSMDADELKAHMIEIPTYETIFKKWDTASKMR